MQTEILIPIIIVAVIVAAVLYSRSKKSHKPPVKHQPPKSTPGTGGDQPSNPKPNPGKPPADPNQPPLPPESPDVLLDRNGKRPGDVGYDPRVSRPADEFSPVEPQGAYYREGPFDPDARWVGPDGVHWTDKHGIHHGP